MSKHNISVRKLWIKTVAITVLCIFYVNTISWAFPRQNIPVESITLQVQNMFKPIVDVADREHQALVLFELRSIMSMALDGFKFPEINAALDECYHGCEKRKRVLNIFSDPRKDENSTIIDIEFLQGVNKGESFRVTLFCGDMGQLFKDPGVMKIARISGEEADNAIAFGMIARGTKIPLINKFRRQIVNKQGGIKKKYILKRDVFSKEADELRQIVSGAGIDPGIKTIVYEAVRCLEDHVKIKFDAIVMNSISGGGKKNNWMLGFNSDSPDLSNLFEGLFAEPTIGYASEALFRLKGNARLEYLLHEPLCCLVGHSEARRIQERLFASTNYKDVGGFSGRKDGTVSRVLRAIIEKKVGGSIKTVYGENCRKIYPFKENRIYVGAVIKNGKRHGGKLSDFVINREAFNKLVKRKYRFASFIVENVRLNAKGGLKDFLKNGENYWSEMPGYAHAPVTVEVENGKVVSVYDKDGKQIYPFAWNNVYVGAVIKDGRRNGGKFVGSALERNGLNKLLGKYPDAIVEDVELDKRGGLKILGVPYWFTFKGLEKALVTLEMKDKKLIAAYDKEGRQIFPVEIKRNFVYVNAEIKDGIRTGGMLMECAPNKSNLNALIAKYPTLIIEKVELNKDGGLFFLNKPYWYNLKGYENALVTLVVEDGKLKEVYDEKGEQLYPFSRGQNMVYVGGRIIKGRRKDGKMVSQCRTKEQLSKGREKYPTMIAENVSLDKYGGFQFWNKRYWYTLKGYENALVTVEVEDKKVKAVYDKKGKQLWPFILDENIVYVNGNMVNGMRVGGKEVEATRRKISMKEVIKEYPTVIVEKVKVVNRHFRLLDFDIMLKIEKDEEIFVAVEIVAGQIEAAYDADGNKVYQVEDAERGLRIFNKLCDEGDISKLMHLFGPEGASRVLLRLFDCFTPQDLLRYNSKFLGSLPRSKRENILNRKDQSLSLEDILKKLRTIEVIEVFHEERTFTDQEIVTEEILRIIYPYVARDYRLLNRIEEETRNKKVSRFLCGCYEKVLEYYRNLGGFTPAGIQVSTKLKFYQKIGMKFILHKKKVMLADEPGLGKTVQVLGAAVNAYDGKGAKKILIICPHIAKTGIWAKQIAKHLRGDQEVMILNRRNSMDSAYGTKRAQDARFIIVNYELLRGDGGKKLRDRITALGIDFIIADEGHKMRNDTETMKAATHFDASYKVLVTGTPLVGRDPMKFYYLLRWLYPEKYPDKKEFKKKYGKKSAIRRLRDEMKEYTLRRYVRDVLVDMPKLKIELRPVRMSAPQSMLYMEIEKNVYQDKTIPIIAQLNLLKRAAIDTALVRRIRFVDVKTGAVKEVASGGHDIVVGKTKYSVIFGDNGDFEMIDETGKKSVKQNIYDGNITMLGGKQYRVEMPIRESYSAKYEALDGIVSDVAGRKKENIVLFTGIVRVAKDLKKRYSKKGYEVRIMYGKISFRERERLIEEFNKTKKPIIFICTYQTGGESIDLTGANYGVLIDEPWTVQERDQIIRRLYRLNQKREVTFYLLQTLRTIDDRIEEVLMEGNLLQKIVLDDPSWGYDNQTEIVKRFISERINGEDDLWRLQLLQGLTREIPIPVDKDAEHKVLSDKALRDGSLCIDFKNNVFMAKLKTEDAGIIEINSIPELLKHSEELASDSRELLKKFFIRRFSLERKGDIRIKDMILWHICEEFIPGFKDIDYHGRLEIIVEMGTYVLRRIMEDEDINCRSILEEIDGISEKLFDEMLYYLDSSNILKLFSLIGVIPQQYYYKGELLRYTSPIKMYYNQSGIYYFDENIVENIAPLWQVTDSGIPDGLTGFSRDVEKVRELTRPEEKRLARQVENRNKAAEIVLVSSHLRDITPIAKRVKRRMFSLFGKDIGQTVDVEEIAGEGRKILVDLIERYARLGAYEETTLKDYLQKRLNPRMYSWGFKMVKHIMEVTADAGVYGSGESGELTWAGQMECDAIAESRLAEFQTKDIVKRLLRKEGFSDEEIDVIELFVYSGYMISELVEQRKDDDSFFSEEEMEGVIDRFQSIMSNLGRDRLLEILENGIEKNDDDSGDNTKEEQDGSMEIVREGVQTPGEDPQIRRLREQAEERENRKRIKKVRSISGKSLEAFAGVRSDFIKISEGILAAGKENPVDILIDLSLMTGDDLENNVNIWAYLILSCKDMKNVNFIFEDRPELAEHAGLSYSLEEKITNAPDSAIVLYMVKEAINRKAVLFGVDEKEKKLINGRISEYRRTTGPETAGSVIGIPIISSELAEWARDNTVRLKDDRYPVVMGEIEPYEENSVPLRNFEAALMIGLVKASLAIARKKVRLGESGAREKYLMLKRKLLVKLNVLYGMVRKDENPVSITEKILEYMLDENSAHRLNRAIDFYLPPIIPMPIEDIKGLHEEIQELLCYA